MMFSIIALAIPLIVIIVIVAIVLAVRSSANGSEGEETEGGEEMIKNLYVYLVLFATLMMTIGGSVSVFMSVADLIAPAPYYQSFEDYKRWEVEETYKQEDKEAQIDRLSESEIQEKYDAMVIREKENQINRAKNSLIKSFGWIIIPFGIFIYFQRNLVKSKSKKQD